MALHLLIKTLVTVTHAGELPQWLFMICFFFFFSFGEWMSPYDNQKHGVLFFNFSFFFVCLYLTLVSSLKIVVSLIWEKKNQHQKYVFMPWRTTCWWRIFSLTSTKEFLVRLTLSFITQIMTILYILHLKKKAVKSQWKTNYYVFILQNPSFASIIRYSTHEHTSFQKYCPVLQQTGRPM